MSTTERTMLYAEHFVITEYYRKRLNSNEFEITDLKDKLNVLKQRVEEATCGYCKKRKVKLKNIKQ
jgi:hypothetical protein